MRLCICELDLSGSVYGTIVGSLNVVKKNLASMKGRKFLE